MLAFLLLAVQCSLVWVDGHFVSQDGASHLYNGVVTWNLIANPASPYSAAYRLLSRPIPNWTITATFAFLSRVAGSRHAEQIVVTVLILAGFFAFHYASGALPGGRGGWSPLANFLFQTNFLWRGF